MSNIINLNPRQIKMFDENSVPNMLKYLLGDYELKMSIEDGYVELYREEWLISRLSESDIHNAPIKPERFKNFDEVTQCSSSGQS